MPRFSWYTTPLKDWDFQARIRSGKLQMRKPNTPDHHIIMLPDDENPASNLTDQSIPLDHHRTKLVLPQETHLAGEWSAHFLDKLYSHPQHYRAPENIPGCHVIGLFNGDLIIDAVSTKRPGEMHYTFHRATRMLQKVTGISLRGGWKEPPVHLGDTPGNEEFRLGDRQAIDGEMEDAVAEVGKARGVAIARLAEDGTIKKEVDFTTYRAHNVLALIAAKKNQHIDATIDDPADDSDATIDLIPNPTPSETNTIEDPDLTDNEDWSATYPQRLKKSNGPSKEVLEERARREYHGKLDRVAVREKRRQLRSVEEAAAMAARAVMAAFDEGVGAAAAMATQNSLNTIRDNPHRSEGRFIEEAAGMAARVAGEIWERLVDEVGVVGGVDGDEELESVDGDAE
ncbi:hypothetical protein EG327_011188 [Venturia inaequalis]|uniref:Uncharacterized protein n=1 Tax=Venturia inaequalis TaxID=5025 RepID=A0A8H3YP38_VENIN|nr:hypothetical protein EG327_011188 [Venturia inaequalis]